jgi:hypothetical protein
VVVSHAAGEGTLEALHRLVAALAHLDLARLGEHLSSMSLAAGHGLHAVALEALTHAVGAVFDGRRRSSRQRPTARMLVEAIVSPRGGSVRSRGDATMLF